MNKRNQLTKLAFLTAAGFASLSVSAATVNSTATATVKNTFTLTNPTPLSFGSVRAVRSGTAAAVANLVVSANPATPADGETNGTAVLETISGATRAVFEISGAAPFGEFVITYPAADVSLTADPAVVGPGAPSLTLVGGAAAWSAYMLTGPRANQVYDGTTNKLQATNTGTLQFNVGATLRTAPGVAGAALIYPDAVYSGNYTLEVNY